jgi:hypothetical protein
MKIGKKGMITLGIVETSLLPENQISVLPLLIISVPFLWVAQDLIGFVDLPDPGPARRVLGMKVWVPMPGQLLVSLFDLAGRRIPRHTENGVVIFHLLPWGKIRPLSAGIYGSSDG